MTACWAKKGGYVNADNYGIPPGPMHIYSVLGYLMLPVSVAGEYAPALIRVHLTF
jgi:hypothetical protein